MVPTQSPPTTSPLSERSPAPAGRTPMALIVARWELQRFVTERSMWLVMALAVLICLGMAWLKHSWGRPVVDGVQGETILILGTTRVGLPYLMIEGLFVLFGPLIPFVATEGVAHDVSQRTHELVMTTLVSSRAYVWGRFLAVLTVSAIMDIILLLSVLLIGPALHAANPIYPSPDLPLVFAIWAVAILPGTLVLASLSFALGTLLPRLAPLLKLLPVLGWVGLVFLSDAVDHGGTWFTTVNPTSYGIVRTQVDHFLASYLASVSGVPDAATRTRIALQLQQTPPDLTPFIVPHLGLLALGILVVAVTAWQFRRFRAVLG